MTLCYCKYCFKMDQIIENVSVNNYFVNSDGQNDEYSRETEWASKVFSTVLMINQRYSSVEASHACYDYFF